MKMSSEDKVESSTDTTIIDDDHVGDSAKKETYYLAYSPGLIITQVRFDLKMGIMMIGQKRCVPHCAPRKKQTSLMV